MAAIARNLGLTGRRQRLLMGLVFTAVAVLAGAVLVAAGLPRGTRMFLFIPFYLGGMGLLQYRDHT